MLFQKDVAERFGKKAMMFGTVIRRMAEEVTFLGASLTRHNIF